MTDPSLARSLRAPLPNWRRSTGAPVAAMNVMPFLRDADRASAASALHGGGRRGWRGRGRRQPANRSDPSRGRRGPRRDDDANDPAAASSCLIGDGRRSAASDRARCEADVLRHHRSARTAGRRRLIRHVDRVGIRGRCRNGFRHWAGFGRGTWHRPGIGRRIRRRSVPPWRRSRPPAGAPVDHSTLHERRDGTADSRVGPARDCRDP